jgi:hypothetical protein
VPSPRIHLYRYFGMLREWPLTGNFRSARERQELAASRQLESSAIWPYSTEGV